MKDSTASAKKSTNVKIAVIFTGLQGTGKTEFYERYFSEAYTRIALSELQTRKNEKALINECIRTHESYVIDGGNLTREDRCRYFDAAREAGYRIVGYYFPYTAEDPQVHSSLASDKNALRRHKKAQSKLEPPQYGEGYDELYTVTLQKGGDYEVVLSKEKKP